MKTDSCAEINDAKRIELKSGLMEPGEHRQYGFIIPASILIGLGVGLLFDHLGSGFLVGLGLGLAGSELIPYFKKSLGGVDARAGDVNVTTLLIGAFFTIIGISFVWAPAAAFWPYALAGLLILSGIWFLVRGFIQG